MKGLRGSHCQDRGPPMTPRGGYAEFPAVGGVNPPGPHGIILAGNGQLMSKGHDTELAYLVIREGTKWTDVFRLVPGRTVTIGRAATNQIIIKDERCQPQPRRSVSDRRAVDAAGLGEPQRDHGRDAGAIQGDYCLTPGDIVRIAQCQLAFVHDLSKAFPEAQQRTGARGRGAVRGISDPSRSRSDQRRRAGRSGDRRPGRRMSRLMSPANRRRSRTVAARRGT